MQPQRTPEKAKDKKKKERRSKKEKVHCYEVHTAVRKENLFAPLAHCHATVLIVNTSCVPLRSPASLRGYGFGCAYRGGWNWTSQTPSSRIQPSGGCD